jgi:hypothetical protein
LIAAGSASPGTHANWGPKYRGDAGEHAAISIAKPTAPIADFAPIRFNPQMPSGSMFNPDRELWPHSRELRAITTLLAVVAMSL